jgi:hypothetical protein
MRLLLLVLAIFGSTCYGFQVTRQLSMKNVLSGHGIYK